MRLIVSSVLIAAAITSSDAWSQTDTDLKAFETRLNAAWTEGTEAAFGSLFYTEGADQGQIESERRNWRDRKISNSSAKSITVKTLYTKDKLPSKLPGGEALYSELVKTLAGPSITVNGQSYQPNLEIAGIAEVVLNRWHEQGPLTLYLSVGYDSEKKLRFTLYKTSATTKG